MRVVSTVKFGWSAGDLAQRQVASWAAGHPLLWISLRAVYWVLRRPALVVGIALWIVLASQGLPNWLAFPLACILPLSWTLRSWLKVLPSPSRGKAPILTKATLKDYFVRLRRLRILKKQWATAAMNAGFVDRQDKERVPNLMDVYSTDNGLTARVACGKVGVPADELSKKADVLAASISGCRAITVIPGSNPGFARLDFMWGDPLEKTVGIEKLPVPSYGRLAYGITESGDPATIAKYKSLLVVGQSGSGKSGALWALLASALADGVPFRLRVVDPAGGVELANLENSPLVREYTDRPGKPAEELIDRAHAAMDKRLQSMHDKQVRMHTPTWEEPWEILVIDELLLMSRLLQKGTASPLGEMLSIGRKTCFTVWALTQVPQIDTVGRIRNLFVQKLVLATDSRHMTDAVLGDGAEARGALSSKISESTPGIGYAAIEGIPGYPRFRTVWVPDDATELIAQGHLPDRVPTRENHKPEDAIENQPHVLYGWYSPEGDLLYVGISNDGKRRASEHLKSADKAELQKPGVTMHIMANFSTRSEALEAEEAAIKELHPKLNIIHNS